MLRTANNHKEERGVEIYVHICPKRGTTDIRILVKTLVKVYSMKII